MTPIATPCGHPYSAKNCLSVFTTRAIYESTVNVELIRPTLRADKAFRIWHQGEEKILNIEFESGFDEDMPARLLLHNVLLYRDHNLPVVSLIVYPFRTKMATPPLLIARSGKDMLIFHYSVLPLFLEDAEHYVTEHILCMDPLLPTMKGANQHVIKQAIDELATLYRDDEVTLAQQIIWMELLLERTTTISKKEKEKVREVLKWNNRPPLNVSFSSRYANSNANIL